MNYKKLIIILCILILVYCLCAFTYTNRVVFYVDEETGVNYICYSAGYKGGICPRYNSDGTLYITKIENNIDKSYNLR